jgi:hypothetical protein
LFVSVLTLLVRGVGVGSDICMYTHKPERERERERDRHTHTHTGKVSDSGEEFRGEQQMAAGTHIRTHYIYPIYVPRIYIWQMAAGTHIRTHLP